MKRETTVLIAPYATWMALMMALPATASGYAIRTIATLATLIISVFLAAKKFGLSSSSTLNSQRSTSQLLNFSTSILVGLLVFGVWILPETLFPPEAARPLKSAFDPAACGWPLTLIRLGGSAFVISVAEELFFRRWLMDFAGFWWSLALFAVEHGDRWAVGVAAGLAYALLARRFGLKSSILAHATTNLVLGIYVVKCGKWMYW